ncbi:MAG: hypothetical protein KKA79_07805 [Nanoarchaeota archaeon]|nr:hypothetical protein [Nanoarchaeota archaeon]MCG2718461.1 hypothetical protein [Nanoarchaeota archaeon]
MKLKKHYLVILIFIISIIFRLYFSFQNPYYSDSESFFHLRNIEHIQETYMPLSFDPLSYDGRNIREVPLFDYLLAGLSFIPHAYKIIPTILISLTVIIAYMIALKLTKDNTSAILSALMTAFLPAVIIPTLNKISIFSLILPLSLYMVYCLIRIEEKRFLNHFVLLCFALPIIHPLALLVSVSFFVYIFLVIAEPDLKLNLLRKEAIMFSIFLALLIEFIIFKKAFLSFGFTIIWQNIPTQILADYFEQANLLDIIYTVGIIPFILGIIGIVFGLIRDKTHFGLITISIAIAPLALLALKLINLGDALIVLSPVLAIISAIAMIKFFRYIRLTKFASYEIVAKGFIFILIIITMIIPSFSTAQQAMENTITEDEIIVLKTLEQEAAQDEQEAENVDITIASSLEEGHYVTYFAKRKVFMDEKFLYTPNVNIRYNNLKTLYTTISGKEALRIANKYGIDYIYISPRTKEIFGIKELAYTTDEKCFRKISESGEVEAYKIRC